MSQELTTNQRERYKICTKTILASLDAQFDGGIALIEVRDYKLYREEFKTFEDYCEEVLKISRRRAYQLIEAAEVKESLPAKASAKIVNESQARALIDVPESQRAAVISEASKNGPLTAQSLEDSASKMCNFLHTEKPIESGKSSNSTPPHLPLDAKARKAPPVLDEIGTKIPEDALPFWNRRQEIQDILTQISKIKCLFEKAKKDGDPMYGTMSNSLLMHLSQAYNGFLEAKPYAVCTTCQGSPSLQPKGCSFCGNKGLISKWNWDTHSRKEVKEMRVRANNLREARA